MSSVSTQCAGAESREVTIICVCIRSKVSKEWDNTVYVIIVNGNPSCCE